MTDAALLLGYLGEGSLEAFDLDADAAEDALAALAVAAGLAGPIEAARGMYRVANATMSRAIRSATIERGEDPRGFTLVAFGGAGPMHAAALAERLGIERVLVPPGSGVLSAYGLLAADETHDGTRTYRTPLEDADVDEIAARYSALGERLLPSVSDPDRATFEREADMRYVGQSHEVTVAATDPFEPGRMADRYHEAHERVHGYRMPAAPIEVVSLRLTATVPTHDPPLGSGDTHVTRLAPRDVSFEGKFFETPVFDRAGVDSTFRVEGPAIVAGDGATVVIPPDWNGEGTDTGIVTLERKNNISLEGNNYDTYEGGLRDD